MAWVKNGLNTSDIVTKAKTDNLDDGIYNLYQGNGLYVATTGSANTYVATFTTPYVSYTTGLTLRVKFNLENTATSTINVDTLGVKTIKKVTGSGVEALEAGDIIADGVYILVYNGADFIIAGQFKVKPMIQVFTSSGTFTAPFTGKYKVTVVGGGGSSARSASGHACGGGGGGGLAKKVVDLTKGDTVTVTVGAGGLQPTGSVDIQGNAGETSSFGTHCSATGGSGGNYSSTSYASGGTGGTGFDGDINLFGGKGGFSLSTTGANRGYNVSFTSLFEPYGQGGSAQFGSGTGTARNGTSGIVVVEWMEG